MSEFTDRPPWCFPVDASGIELTMSEHVTICWPSVVEGAWDVWDSSRCCQGAHLRGSYDSLDEALERARAIVAEQAVKP